MTYSDYFAKFNTNDIEHVIQHIPNAEAEEYLLENAPRLYCPDADIEETVAFGTWTMRKHIKKTEAGFGITELLTKCQLPWAGRYNVINAPLTHHLLLIFSLLGAIDFIMGNKFGIGKEFERVLSSLCLYIKIKK